MRCVILRDVEEVYKDLVQQIQPLTVQLPDFWIEADEDELENEFHKFSNRKKKTASEKGKAYQIHVFKLFG